MPEFRKVDFEAHMHVCVEFRADSFKESFPPPDDWKKYWDEDGYRSWVVEHAKNFLMVFSIFGRKKKLLVSLSLLMQKKMAISIYTIFIPDIAEGATAKSRMSTLFAPCRVMVVKLQC